MPAGYAFNGYVGLAKEASGGVAVAATSFVQAVSEDLAATLDRFELANIVGRYSETDDAAGLVRVGGSIVIPGNPVDLGHFLLGAMGIQSNTVVASGFLSKHEFRPATSDWDAKFAERPFTYTIYRDVTSAQRYLGCNVSQLQFSAAPNQDLRMTAQIVGKSTAEVAAVTPSYVGSPVAPFTFDTCSVSVGGVAVDFVEGLNLTYNNQLQGVPTLNASTAISRIRRGGQQMVRLSGSFAFERIDEYEDFLNQTERAVSINFFKSVSFAMLFEIPRFVYTAHPLGMSGRQRLTVAFEGTGRYHTGSTLAVKVSLWNTTSGY